MPRAAAAWLAGGPEPLDRSGAAALGQDRGIVFQGSRRSIEIRGGGESTTWSMAKPSSRFWIRSKSATN